MHASIISLPSISTGYYKQSGADMKHRAYNWGTKTHERTIFSTAMYYLTMLAFYLAPNKVSRLMREKGFAVKPFHLNAAQRELLQQAHRYFLEFKHNKIRVFEWGAGPVIVLVHGWGGRALQLSSFVQPLLDKGYKVVAFDHKGHGESSSGYSSYLEIVRSTDLVVAHYANDLSGVIAHSIGSNAVFKVSEYFAQPLKIALVAPMENFPHWLEAMRRRLGIYEKLFARVIEQIETDSGLNLLEQCEFDYDQISRHDVLLVHDQLDRINKISASLEIQRNLPDSSLMQTENLGHSCILGNAEVVGRVVAHFGLPA
jgi:pimeloyl-ACP methyl ester carboxylesterase